MKKSQNPKEKESAYSLTDAPRRTLSGDKTYIPLLYRNRRVPVTDTDSFRLFAALKKTKHRYA